MAQYTLIKFDSEQQFLEHAVQEFKALADEAIAKRGKFCVALSGGSSPKVLFEGLSKAQIDWSKIHLYWSDERYVSHSDPESNYGMAHRYLLSHISIPPLNIHGISTEQTDPHESARKYEEAIKNVQFDLMYLGIGTDGHTASLFPGISFPVNLRVAALFVRKLGAYRITLLPECINESREIRFLVSGDAKKTVVDYVTSEPDVAIRYPCQLIRTGTILAY